MLKKLGFAFLLLWLPAIAAAQSAQVPIPLPKALVFPNYDNVLLGKDQTLEAGSYVARANDASSNFYNPAGLVQAESTSLNASSTGWVMSRITSQALDKAVTSSKIDNVPGYIGVVFGSELGERNLRLGISMTRTVAWSPGSIDISSEPSMAGAIDRVTYSTTASFGTLLYQVAAAWAPVRDRSLRLGLSFGMADTSYSAANTLSGLLSVGGQPSQFLATLRATGDVLDLVVGAGLQWDVVGGLTVGVLFRTKGYKIGSSSLVTYESSYLKPTDPTNSFFRDANGAFDYQIPLETGLGVAYNFGRAQLELDLRYHAAVGAYNFYGSNQPIQLVTQHADGTTSSSTEPGPVAPYAARQVLNTAVGGNVKLGRIATVHAGFNSAMSPVQDPNLSPFRKANLYGFTGGFDFQVAEHFGFSLGAGYQWGFSPATPLTVAGQTIQGNGLRVESISLLYAISASF